MTTPGLRITREKPTARHSRELIAELSAEIGALYGDDGSGAFTPQDVMIPRAAFVVAWLDENPVGCGALRPMPDTTIAEIKRVYVRRAARGQGIAGHILTKLEYLAGVFGYRKIWLETGIYQPEAIRLYEKNGYTRIDCYGIMPTNR